MARLARTAIMGAPTALVASGPAAADTVRCNGEVIDDGARAGVLEHVVLEPCGEPDERYGTTWVYERADGPRKVVRFGGDGQLARIEEKR